ncbi:MAG: hypothetical protein QM601_10445 [Pseudoxanthomonas sp.]
MPLVRKLDRQMLAAPIEVEFDVPAQADLPDWPIFIGLRVASADSAEAADRLRRATIAAEMHLYRLHGTDTKPAILKRFQRVGRSESEVVTVGPDGQVPKLDVADADFMTMQAAGLIDPSVDYKELMLAFLSPASPGRYRATVHFNGDLDALVGENAEFLIAFSRRPK